MVAELTEKNGSYFCRLTFSLPDDVMLVRLINTGTANMREAEDFLRRKIALFEELEQFLIDRKESGVRAATIDDYQHMCSLFIAQTRAESVSEITTECIKEYRNSLNRRALKNTSINSYMKQLKMFLKWLEEKQAVPESVTDKIKPVRAAGRQIYLYTDSEIQQIFQAVSRATPEKWMKIRNQTLIALMYDSGLRRNELTQVRECDFRRNNNGDTLLLVHGKGGKDRLVPLGKYTIRLLSQYRELLPFMYPDDGCIFRNIDNGPLTNDAIMRLVRNMKKELPFSFFCHQLRHNFATNYCIDQIQRYGQVDIFSLARVLGHSDVKTTMIYVHVAKEYTAQNFTSKLDGIFNY